MPGSASRNKRALTGDADVFEHNAWDDIEWSVERLQNAASTVERQKAHPVSAEDQTRLLADQAGHWNRLYAKVEDRMYADRSWLTLEFPGLLDALSSSYGPCTLVELGSGPGNTFLPLAKLNNNPLLKMHALDFSSKAIEILRDDARFDQSNLFASCYDLSSIDPFPAPLQEGTADFVMAIFVLSALSPDQWHRALHNIIRLLKPGGRLYFRDFGRYDLCQLRFKNERWLQDNFYTRGDGTQVYFFDIDELRTLLTSTSFDNKELLQESLANDQRLLLNRKRQLQMYRVWVQGTFLCHAVAPTTVGPK